MIFQEGPDTTRPARELWERVLSDKYLTVKEWQKFAAERSFKESAATKAMVKALAAAEKAGSAPPAEQLAVLDALEAAGRDLLKLHKGDKKLESYLEDVYKPLKKYRKEAEKTQAKEEKAEAKAAKSEAKAAASTDEDEDEDDDGPAFLEPKRLFRQLSLCRADPALRVHFAYIDGPEKEPGSLGLSPKLSGPAMFKKLVLATGVKTGAYGTAWVNGTELMLQPDKALGGLARKLRAPVKACGFKVTRIVLCHPDGSVMEAEAEDEAAGDDASGPAAAAGAAAAPAAARAEPAEPVEPPAAPATPSLEAQFITRLKALMPRLAQHAATREGQAAKLLASEAGLMARKADFAAGLKHLDKIETLLARLAGAPPSPPTAATPATAVPPSEPATPAPPSAVARLDPGAWQRARDQWRDASEAVDDQLNALRRAVVQGARTEPEYAEALAEIAGAGLNAITGRHRVQVAVALRELGDGAPARVEAHAAKALDAVTAFRQFLRTSPQIAACDANPFEVEVQIRATLEPALDGLAQVLTGA